MAETRIEGAQVNVEKLREALDDWVQEYVWLLQRHAPKVPLEPLEEVVEAARSVLDASEVWWCDFHDGGYRIWQYPTCPHAVETGDDADCSMVRVRLVPVEGD